MKTLARAGLAALVISLAGCQSEQLPDAPKPIRDAYSDPGSVTPNNAKISKGDATKKYNTESGASAEEH